jgi:hypothetical protein
MSASPFLTLSITGCTPGTPLMVNGTLSRRASSRPRSAAGPLTSPLFASVIACTGLLAIKVARRVPVGTSSSASAAVASRAAAIAKTITFISVFIRIAGARARLP